MSTLAQSAHGTWERFPCWPPASIAAMAASSRSARSHQTRAAIRRSGEVKSEFVCKIAAALPAYAFAMSLWLRAISASSPSTYRSST
jgi:hypothetical protein